MKDYVVIGSGIIGSLITRALSKYPVSVHLLDKENDIASHQTIANSAIIHSGHDPKPGSLKAKLCVLGNQLYDTLEQELDIDLLRTGALVVAHNEAEEAQLAVLLERAHTNGVTDVKIIDQPTIQTLEPRLSKGITKALSLPTTKVTFPWEVAIHAVANAIHNGATFQKNAEVVSIEPNESHFTIQLKDGSKIEAKHVINAAGVMSDLIAAMIEPTPEFKILPRKGEYFVLDRKAVGLFKNVIYPLPTQAGKGVLIVPQTHGNILLGPTSYAVTDREDESTTRDGLAYVKTHLQSLSNDIPFDLIIRTFAGVRATSSFEDFYIQESKVYPHFYHVAGIDSPGLTAAPAIAQYLVEHVIKIDLPIKPDYDPIYRKTPLFHTLSEAQKIEEIAKYPKHGKLICKCEKVTEQDIIHAIHGPTGNDTIKGIKKRSRAGAGLCQGGYCESEVLKIIARETGEKPNEVNYYAEHTPILVKETKTK
ncbi:NAD(P)/FAD-dependent oxidoreductase [Acholeplasma vituli]|uniref:NAD(P)/FAD-dependent oxidoreductase n=1 Tax=Paracholeplasma vituli TaxID=69473 RepID=A0ABT2PX21_9MOLU|nr:NAD(P)/FAD-dependent oxidoreductase [Paracholeplasma vituli]MCU0105506.1 NAD(P)/FAD-dependent oxidoreductase [Paracholeplasma vituli]